VIDRLTAELEAALVRELRSRFELENWQRFGDRLEPPVLALDDSERFLGRWVPAARTILMSRPFVLARPWPEVAGVLAHEMAHQFVDEVLGVRDESAHGETFRRVCAERGVDARAAGAPTAVPDADGVRALERVRKLLALAGSANQHEAELAMRRAHELMLRHNIERAAADRARDYQVRHLGDPSKRSSSVEVDVVALLADYFFVEVIRVPVYLPLAGKRGNVYEVIGTHANVEMAAHVYAFLLATADRLWRDNRDDARVQSGHDRVSYQSGVIRGFRDKLAAERTELRGVGLVYRGDAGIGDFMRARHPRMTSRRRRTRVASGAHAAGREAGRKVVLHKPVEHGASGGAPRLLRGGRD